MMVQDGAKMGQDGAKMVQDGAKMAQDGPTWGQDGGNMGHDGALKAPLHLLPCGMQVRRPQQPQLTTQEAGREKEEPTRNEKNKRIYIYKLPINRFWRPHII